MRILHIGHYYYPVMDGRANYLFLLCQTLKKTLDVNVLANNVDIKTTVENYEGIRVVRVGTLRLSPKLASALPITLPFWMKKMESDIIHMHLENPAAVISYFIARPKGKLVVTYHMDIVKQRVFSKFYKSLLLRFLQKADRIIATSPNYVRSSEVLRKFQEKCVVIPLGIDISRFEPVDNVQRKSEQIKNRFGERIILFVGRLVYYKGIEYLIEAMQYINAKLLIVGEGYLERKLKSQAKDLGIGDRIVFLGKVTDEDLVAYYYAADVFVLPSVYRTEAFGIVQLEAQACGVPVVSTKLDTGVEFANIHGVTGLTVPPKSPEALAGAIDKLLSDPTLAKKLGENGRKRVAAEFSIEANCKRVLEIYRNLIIG